MKRNLNQAFTLIELLAVIVILAIIALIATPIILGIVEDARKDAFLRSVELVVSTTDVDIVNKTYEEEYTYTIEDGNISNLEVGIKNTAGMNGSITYDKEGKETYAVNNGTYCVMKTEEMDKAQIKDYVEGECEIAPPIYANGQRVYFDVVKGTGCSMEEYASSYDTTATDFLNSKTGYNGQNGSEGQNNCLLFYAFNDDGGKNINLILDHNTTALTYWTDANTSSNTNGPITVLSELKTATDNWNGTITPEDYTVFQVSGETTYGNYTIDYNNEDDTLDYKARLITADEIAQITGADKKEGLMFDENTSDRNNFFLFETLTQGLSVCTENCEYAWLYDRTNSACTQYGCLNNADSGMTGYGYWTGTSALGYSFLAWYVSYRGSLLSRDGTYGNFVGVRPVITVSKSKIFPGEAPVIPE